MNVSKNTNAIKILIFLLIAGAIAGIIIALTNSDSETKTTPSPPDIETKWVAVGTDLSGNNYGNIMYSTDGQNWKKTSSGDSFSASAGGVAYGTSNGASPLWVAVGDDTGYGNIMYSTDGQNWTETSSGDSFSELGTGVAYGTSNGTSPLWVAVGNAAGSNRYGNIMYSTDGKEWTKTSSGDSFSFRGRGVAYGTSNGTSPLWVAVGNDSTNYGKIMYSTDGKEWTKTSSGDSFNGIDADAEGRGVAYGTSNGTSPLWVAVGNDGPSGGYGSIMYSSDGKIWTETSSGDSFSVAGLGVAYGTSNGTSPLWVAVGNDVSAGYGSIMYSSDGKVWKKTSSGDSFTGTNATGRGVAYGTSNGTSPLWVAVGNDGSGGGYGSIMYSSDGKIWKKTSSGDSFSVAGLGVAFDQVLYGVCTTNYHP